MSDIHYTVCYHINQSFNLFQIFTICQKKDPIKTTGWLLGSLPEWIKRGYIDDDGWNGLRDYVNDELLSPENLHIFKSVEEKRNQEREKLSKEDRLPTYVLSIVSGYVDSSKLTDFALKQIGLKDASIEMIREDYFDDTKRVTYEVKEPVRHISRKSNTNPSSSFFLKFKSIIFNLFSLNNYNISM